MIDILLIYCSIYNFSCDDFLQNYNLKVFLWHADSLDDGKEFIVAGDKEKLQPKAEEVAKEAEKKDEDDDEICEIEVDTPAANGDRKRPHEEENGTSSKKPKLDSDNGDEEVQEVSAPPKEVTSADLKRKLEEDDGVVCIE